MKIIMTLLVLGICYHAPAFAVTKGPVAQDEASTTRNYAIFGSVTRAEAFIYLKSMKGFLSQPLDIRETRKLGRQNRAIESRK